MSATSKYTPLTARHALLAACKKTKSGSSNVAVPATVVGECVQLFSDLENKVAELQADQLKQMEGGLGMKSFITTQGEELNEARARLSTLEASLAEARQELAEQEREKLALIRQLPPEGDGGLWALQSLEDYFRQGGHRAALANIRAVAHNMGWCLDDMGADQIVPTTGICPLCDCNSAPHPAPKPSALNPLEGDEPAYTPTAPHTPKPLAGPAKMVDGSAGRGAQFEYTYTETPPVGQTWQEILGIKEESIEQKGGQGE